MLRLHQKGDPAEFKIFKAPGKQRDKVMNANRERQSIRKKVGRLAPIFQKYGRNLETLESILKWKSMVLILGNFSSGKSTLINELLGGNIQRTGQSPTDDAFTLITAAENNGEPGVVPGSTLVADENLPFTGFKEYGENFISHFRMQTVNHPGLKDLAIIDTPGMLDAVTEKDRGYDYDKVIGELARMADLVLLMFDPHKAGTIREVYNIIRNTLPENAGEDRVVFVMSRIDECDNLGDLVRSYGTLCWNLSQMTGRKDIPRIFLTYAPGVSNDGDERLREWLQEREELKQRILAAPDLRFSHMLQHIDKQVGDLAMMVEAAETFSARAGSLLARTMRVTAILAATGFLFGDLLIKAIIGWPAAPLLPALFRGAADGKTLILPILIAAAPFVLSIFWFRRYGFEALRKKTITDPDDMVRTDTPFRRHQWQRLRGDTIKLISQLAPTTVFSPHTRAREKLLRFIERELQPYYHNHAGRG